jgi:uncharacterized RDD family membrane protein YckC
MRADPPAESLAGHYAGPVTRAAAYALDAFASVASYGLVLSLVAFLWQLLRRDELTLPAESSFLWLVGLVLWIFVYFAGAWAVAAKTPGMAVLGLRVVQRDGGDLATRHAVVRALAFPLGALTAGIGYLGIVFGNERRALHDVLAGTTVVYDWDARAARWRLLSRTANTSSDRYDPRT